MNDKYGFSLMPKFFFTWTRVDGKMKLTEIAFVFLCFSKIWQK